MAAIAPPNPSGPTPLLLGMPAHLWPALRRAARARRGHDVLRLTEPEAGSDAQSIRTRATRQDDGSWSSTATSTTSPTATAPTSRSCSPSPTPRSRAAGGITAFVVPGDQLTRGKVQWTMADTHPAEILLDGARVPADHVIGEVGSASPRRWRS